MTWTERVAVRDGVGLSCRDRCGPDPSLILLHGPVGHPANGTSVPGS